MAMDYAVAKIKGMDPERFVVVGVDWGACQLRSLMTKDMSEKEMRAHLKKAGVSDATINASIENARKTPL